MKKHVSSNISTTTVKNNSLEEVNHTELKQNDDRTITWSIKTRSFERLMGEISNFQDYSTQICQNWLKAHETEIFCHENIQQYKRILMVLKEIVKLIEEIKTTIQCQQLKKLEISEKIRTIVSDQLEIEPNKITPTANLANDLGVDSLERLEIVLALEEAFSTKISSEIAGTLLTVQQLIDYVTSIVQEKNRLSTQLQF